MTIRLAVPMSVAAGALSLALAIATAQAQSGGGGSGGGTSGGGSARREGAAGHDMRTCMATWDKGTHITKARWREICARTLREQQATRQEAERNVRRR